MVGKGIEFSDSWACGNVWNMNTSPREHSPSNEPEGTIIEVGLPPAVSLQRLAACNLACSAEDGRLCAALNKVRQEEVATASAVAAPAGVEPCVSLAALCRRAASTLADAAHDSRLEAALGEQCAKHEEQEAQPTRDLNVLRENTRNLFLCAETDGRLATALQNMPKSMNKASGEESKACECLKDLRSRSIGDGRLPSPGFARSVVKVGLQARKLLLEAVDDQRLLGMLTEAHSKMEIAQVRRRMGQKIAAAAAQGQLTEALLASKRQKIEEHPPPLDMLTRARLALRNASCDGRLLEALSEVKTQKQDKKMESLRLEAQDLMCQAQVDGSVTRLINEAPSRPAHPASSSTAQDPLSRVRQALGTAALDGRLTKALATVPQQQQQQQQKQGRTTGDAFAAQSREDSMELARNALASAALNSRLKDQLSSAHCRLIQAAKKGQLEEALKDAQQKKQKVLRQRTKKILESASMDGRLEHALRLVPQHRQPLERRMQAGSALAAAAVSGRLEDVVAQVKVERLNKVRDMAWNGLKDAASDGRLAEALAKTLREPATSDVAAIKEQASLALASAASDGRLKQAAASVQRRRRVAEVQAHVRDALTGAAIDGRLVQALNTAGNRGSNAREHLRKVLSNAAIDGRLTSTIVAHKQQQSRQQQQQQTIASKQDAGQAVKEALRNRHLQKEDPDARVQQVRAQIQTPLSTAALDGRLAVEVAQVTRERAAAKIQKQALQVLSTAACDGRLESALAKILGHAQQPVATAHDHSFHPLELTSKAKTQQDANELRHVPTAADGQFADAVATLRQKRQQEKQWGEELHATTVHATTVHAEDVMNDVDLSKERIRRALAAAALDGRLLQALKKSDAEAAEEASAALRCQAKHALCNAAFSGKLAAAITEVKQQKQNDSSADVGLEAKHALCKAAFNGKLAAALFELKKQKQKEDPVNACLQARHATCNAAFNGKLEAALTKVKQQRESQASGDPYSTARSTLRDADVNEKLATTVTEVKQQRENEVSADLFRQARSTLCDAAFSGKLAVAITDVKQKRQKETSSDLFRQARGTLCDAAFSGKLAATITEVKQLKEVEELRLQLRNALSNTAQSGQLEEVCRQVSLEKARMHAKESSMQALGSGGSATAIEEVFQKRGAISDSFEDKRKVASAKDVKTSSRRKSSKPGSRILHTRHHSTHAVASSAVIRLDLDEDADDTNLDIARASSLARGYNALGIELHGMGDGDLCSPKVPNPALCMPPDFVVPTAPASRHGSRFGASRHRAALEVASAMALDLDMNSPVSQQRSHRKQIEPMSASQGAMALDLGTGTTSGIRWGFGNRTSTPKDHRRRFSSSVGTISYPRKTEAASSKVCTLLPPVFPPTKAQRSTVPALHGCRGGFNAEAAASNTRRARSEHRWGNNLAIF